MTVAMNLTAKNVHKLSPRLQQSNHILQLAAPAFQQFVLAQLRNNPFLTSSDEDDEDQAIVEIVEYTDNNIPSSGCSQDNPQDPLVLLCDDLNLEQYLLKQLACMRIDTTTYSLCALIINALDENGYFKYEFDQLVSDECKNKIKRRQWNQALKLVQQVGPGGIAARSLSECLALQIDADNSLMPQEKKQLYNLVHHGLQDLADGKYEPLANAMKVSQNKLFEYISYIHQLDPKPGRQFAQTTATATMPDVYVTRHGNSWRIVPNFKSFPRINMYGNYGQTIRQTSIPSEHPLRKEWHKAQWLVESVEKRHSTICSVAKVILSRQRMFFSYGEEALQPLLINDIAAELGLHASTISRATSNKYMSTPNGVFHFRHFISRGMNMNFGGQCSTRTIQAKIKQLIEQESASCPLSDVQIHKKLTSEDINVAKRTVTKYRQQLNIPAVNKRRRLRL